MGKIYLDIEMCHLLLVIVIPSRRPPTIHMIPFYILITAGIRLIISCGCSSSSDPISPITVIVN